MPIKANEFILKALISDGITGLIQFLPLYLDIFLQPSETCLSNGNGSNH